MKSLFLISAVLIQFCWCYGSPKPNGVGVLAYADSTGNRYESFYEPKFDHDGDLSRSSDIRGLNEINSGIQDLPFREFYPPLPPLPSLQPLSPIKQRQPLTFPSTSSLSWRSPIQFPRQQQLRSRPFFLDHLIHDQRNIFSIIENQQRAAYEAAQNSFGAFNAFPYIPNFDFRYPQDNYFKSFGSRSNFDMPRINSAYAAGAVGPGYKHQVAGINPPNPQTPNVDVTVQNPDGRNGLGNHVYSVSSSSFASSVNNNGEIESKRGADTVVYDNGKISKYSVRS